jgi:hypothetical protein
MIALKSTPVIAGAALLIGIAIGWRVESWRSESARNELIAKQSAAIQKAEIEQRSIEQQRQQQIEQVRIYATEQIQKANADTHAAVAAANSLREQSAKFARTACPSAQPAAGSKTTEPAAMVLAELLASADTRAGELAEAYDRARIAGLACEQAYQSLEAKP